MTQTRYLLCRVALAFGLSRKNLRMGDAAGEMHLLKEAEAHLGEAIWKEVEHIEELSVEYWNLRKLIKERTCISFELEECQRQLTEAQEQRSSLLGITNEPFQDLVEEKQTILNKLEDLARDRDQIVAKAREIRRAHDGIKMKQEVLEKEGSHTPAEMEKISTRLIELKQSFAELKIQRQAVATKIEEGDAQIDIIESEIAERKTLRREKASEAFQHIGEGNQKTSTFRAEIGVLDTQMRQLYSEIGRYVSRNAIANSACKTASKRQHGMVEVMSALRTSIQLNHKLAELS